MRIYISGKIGEKVISEATRQKFARAAKMLAAHGDKKNTVIDPASEYIQMCIETHYSMKGQAPWYDETLLYMLHWLQTCTAVYMLADWKKSPGATAEYWYAVAAGRSIYFENEQDAREHARRWFWAHAEEYTDDERPWDVVLKEFEDEAVKKIWLPIAADEMNDEHEE